MSSKLLENKVAIITGASSGIGKTTAFLFAEEGALVVLVARSKDIIKKVEMEIQEKGGKALSIVADLRNSDQLKPIIDRTIKQFGGIDILINSAGVIATGSIKTTT
ncbi:MAG: SDR family NAD(P)-dependent oxidoreductase, partial [Calditrichia bacterium]|nr:SDR family NAD(P)-dependent oxidoreductase [Calditrichia bacterium]